MQRFSSTRLTVQAIVYVALVAAYGVWRGPHVSQTVSASQPAASKGTLALPVSDLGQPVTPNGVNAILPPPGEALGSILMYHYVRTVDPTKDPLGYRLSVTDQELDQELSAMSLAGYRPISIDDFVAKKGDAKSVAMTFDDGYEDFYTDAYPILKKYGWHATLYVITGKVGTSGYLTWPQIRELQAAGFEIGAHTVDHKDLATQTPLAQYHEVFDSKAALEKQLGQKVTAFCYPSGRYDAVTESLVQQAGFTSATTTHTGLASKNQYDPFQLPRIRVEPPLTPTGLLREMAQ